MCNLYSMTKSQDAIRPVVTAPDGEMFYQNNFDAGSPPVSFGTLDGGRLLVPTSTAGTFGHSLGDKWAFLRKEFDLPRGAIAGAYLYISAQYGSRS